MALPILFSSIYLLWFTSLNNKLALTTPIIVIMILSVDIVNPILPLPNKIKSYYPIIEQYHDIYDYGGKDIADFSKANTSKDAIFLVPPNFGSFRGAAQRAIVVDRKCILFNDKGLLEWWNRINDCYGKVNVLSNYDEQRQMLSSNYNRISNEKINFLKNKYNISYAILDINTEIGFKMIFKDDQYKLIKID